MELKYFLEKYVEDHDEKFMQVLIDLKKAAGNELQLISKEQLATFTLLKFEQDYFHEALQNYTDLVCKKQRENCAGYNTAVSNDKWNKDVYMNIHEAPQPTIEDLINKTEEL